jgi:trehalose/maltose transport system substrate-binding protein
VAVAKFRLYHPDIGRYSGRTIQGVGKLMAYPSRTREEARRRIRQSTRRAVLGIVCLLLTIGGESCSKGNQPTDAITLTLIDQGWSSSDYQSRLNEVAEFTRQTGIRVEFLPGPETAAEQLATWHRLLEGGAKVPDVYGIDVIWPGILADNLLDLRAYIPEQEIKLHFPELIANNTVNGRLVALPSFLGEGMLFYRVDLLRKYGYRAPPTTWKELEVMARRIQSGERANGNKDFWGFVWEGAPSEALICNALEWQVSEGGGTILDENGKVTVNNPQSIRAWDRAARWVGSISPPGVVAFKEWDASNMWQAGKAAFLRNWSSGYIAARAPDSMVRDRFDIAPLPRGSAGMAATLGGAGYGVSAHSLHPREAAMLVRFLCSRNLQATRLRKTSEAPTISELYEEPEVLANNPHWLRVLEIFRKGIALRPSRAAGKMYPDVSRAYWEAVHAVLTRKTSATQAAQELQDKLEEMLKTPAVRANTELDKVPANVK